MSGADAQVSSTTASPALLSRRHRISVLLALALSAFAFNTTENLPIGLLRLISSDLDVSASSTGYLITAYGLTVALASLPLAILTRNVPRRQLLSAVLAALAVASAAGVLVPLYSVLLGARLVTALAQAVFWAVTTAVAVGLFDARFRGRVVALMSVGGSMAMILGVPAGTLLGQLAGWKAPFLVLSGLSLVALAVVAALLPTTSPEASHGARGSAPNVRRFTLVLVTTVLSVTGMFTAFTYVAELLTGPASFPGNALGPLLFVFGLAGTAGVVGVGAVVDRSPQQVLPGAVLVQAAALLGLAAFAPVRAAVVAGIALLGVSAAPVFMVTQARILVFTPGRTELGLAANSAAFNVGIAAGAALGGLLLPALGVRATFLTGALITAVALASAVSSRSSSAIDAGW